MLARKEPTVWSALFLCKNRKICPSDLFQNALPAKVIRILFFKNGKREEMIFTLSQKSRKVLKLYYKNYRIVNKRKRND